MSILLVGLVLFLGVHSVRLVADGARSRMIARIGAGPWKGLYSLASIAGFVVLVWGFGLAREQPVPLYAPPPSLRHLNALFTLAAFVLVFAAYPPNHIKRAIGHPMLAGVVVWSIGHLLATGMLHDVVLFGAFLLWGVADFAVSRRRDRIAGTRKPDATWIGDAVTVALGVGAWALFAFSLHQRWIGVDPFA